MWEVSIPRAGSDITRSGMAILASPRIVAEASAGFVEEYVIQFDSFLNMVIFLMILINLLAFASN